jgi:acyl-CoA synthetase (AMP-forming)/AMP-acid ligase II
MKFAVMEPFNQRIAMRYHMPGLGSGQKRLKIAIMEYFKNAELWEAYGITEEDCLPC